MDSEQETQAPAATEGEQPSNESENSAENALDYSALTVNELKDKLKELGLPLSGKKSDLIDRLNASNEKVSDTEKVTNESDEGTSTEPLFSIEELESLSRNELRELRKDYHKKAEELRIKRDELNLLSQSHASDRNDLNVKAKEHMDNVHLFRDRRNGLNIEVGEIRDERREVSNGVNNLKDHFLRLKRKRFSGRNLPPVSRLRKQIQELEIKQMTTPLTTSKERGLVEKIGLLQQQIKEYNEMLDSDSDVAEARSNYKDSEKSRKIILKEMNQTRQEAQREHDQMYRDLKKSRSTRKKADSYQRAFIKSKTEADEIHGAYIELLKEIQAIDRIIGDRRKATSSPGEATETMASADELYQKFLGGDKLTTNELMVIQKAGLL